jgi:ethanolamine utilization protein EutN
MELGVVIGTLVATVKDPALIGTLLLLVQPITHLGAKRGNPLVVVDPDRNAGPGDVIVFVYSPDASMAFSGDIWAPVDAAVVAIVNHVDIGKTVTIRAGQEWEHLWK